MALELYNEIKEIAILLYKEDNTGFEKLDNIIERLKSELIEKASKSISIEYVNCITQCLKRLNVAIIRGDRLAVADILYNEIGMIFNENNKEVFEEITEEYQTNKECIYEKNVQALQKKMELYEDLVLYAEKFLPQESKVLIDKYGNMVIYHEDYCWRLNSFYNRKLAAEYGMDIIKQDGYISILFIMGLGNTDYIKKIVEEFPKDMVMLIYEPEKQIFAMNMYYKDMTSILERKNTFLFVEGLNEKEIGNYVSAFATNIGPKYVKTFHSPSYVNIYGDKIKKIVSLCIDKLTNNVIFENTICHKAKQINYNRIRNMSSIVDSILLSDLKKEFEYNMKLDTKTAIIVAAGPSLDKNIQYLKAAEGKAFILAVDSSIRMLLKYDIRPDAIVTVDPNKEKVLFQNDLVMDTPLIYTGWSTYDNICHLKGEKIYCNTDEVSNAFLRLLDKTELCIGTGGNVATTAISVAAYLGFGNLVTIGLDLAFKEDKKHASVVYDDGGVNAQEAELYDYVEGQNGEKLLTYKNFIFYKKAIEERIEHDHWNLINATEGGALIKGSIAMTLKEAIEKYCDTKCNFKMLIKKAKKSFTKKEKEVATGLYRKFISECDDINEAFCKCIRLYDDIGVKKNMNDVQSILLEIDSIYKEIDLKFMMPIITDYATEKADKELESLYQQMSDKSNMSELSDVQEIALKGKKICQVYQDSVQVAKQLLLEVDK